MTFSLKGAAFGLAILTLAGAAPVQAQPIRITDDRGAAIALPAPSRRLAAVSTVASDFLVALGQKPVAIARTGDKVLPKFLWPALDGLPDLGSRAVPNMEMLAETRPDLIVAIRRYTERAAPQYEKIAPYVALDLASYDDSLNAVKILGDVTGHAPEAAQMNARFEAMVKDYAQKAPGGQSAAILWGDANAPWIYFNGYMPAEMLGRLKIKNVMGDNPDPKNKIRFSDQMNLEELLVKDPDIIFMFLPPDVSMDTNPVWKKLKAVKTGKAYAVGVQWMETHGPIAREMVLKEMAHLAYPGLFPAPDLPAEVRARPFAKP